MCVKSLMSGMAIGNAFFQFGNIESRVNLHDGHFVRNP